MDTEENHPIRKALKSLPMVKAEENFDQRLQRRIADQGEPSSPSMTEFGGRRTIPAFAYSVLGVFVISVFTYYMFMRTDLSPIPPAPPNAAPDQNGTSMTSPQPTLQKFPQQSPSETKAKEGGSAIRKNDVVLGKQSGYRTSVPAREPARASAAEKDETQMPEMTISQPPERAAMKLDRSESPMPPASMEKRMSVDQAKSTTGTLELKSNYDGALPQSNERRILEPRVKDALGVGVMNSPVTSSMRDSVRADSLKRLQKQILRTKPKGKKPLD